MNFIAATAVSPSAELDCPVKLNGGSKGIIRRSFKLHSASLAPATDTQTGREK
jgi:hypothetical protein